MQVLIIILIILVIVNIILTIWKNINKNDINIADEMATNRAEVNKVATQNRQELANSITEFEKKTNTNIVERFNAFEKSTDNSNNQVIDKIKLIDGTINKQLDNIRKTVDEKLQSTLEKRLNASFKQVSERLEKVHQGLGEMQNVAVGVGDLKKVLSNVKTRGILGEYQLGSILEQMLSPEQYSTNIATKQGSQANVEFAIKLPGKEAENSVWVPLDSKFPLASYNLLLDAFEVGDKNEIENLQKVLLKSIENFAKDISTKYIDPPHTTDFAIMFLPAEGLYAEVLRHPDLFRKLQNKYKITITGPTTLSAFLSSLQMGFKTLAVQQRSSEVWDVLKSVKTEFETFSGVFAKVQNQLNTASNTLETLQGTRMRVIGKKLQTVETPLVLNKKQQILDDF